MEKTPKKVQILHLVLITILAVIVLFNSYQLSTMGSVSGSKSIGITKTSSGGNAVQEALETVVPQGTPEIYGEELGVSFDSPQTSLTTLANLDYSISYSDLDSKAQKRYDLIGSIPHTACEFCCGIGAAGFAANHQSACGCAHNLAFSGLTKYLLKNHADEFSDEEIAGEIISWKALFFPKQMTALYLQQEVEAGRIDASALGDLPDMVGGC